MKLLHHVGTFSTVVPLVVASVSYLLKGAPYQRVLLVTPALCCFYAAFFALAVLLGHALWAGNDNSPSAEAAIAYVVLVGGSLAPLFRHWILATDLRFDECLFRSVTWVTLLADKDTEQEEDGQDEHVNASDYGRPQQQRRGRRALAQFVASEEPPSLTLILAVWKEWRLTFSSSSSVVALVMNGVFLIPVAIMSALALPVALVAPISAYFVWVIRRGLFRVLYVREGRPEKWFISARGWLIRFPGAAGSLPWVEAWDY